MGASYIRVLPRDLFNEANLLKCYGRLWIALENRRYHGARFITEDAERFEIEQDPHSGAIYVANVAFEVHGRECTLSRPLNSRREWPLYCEAEGGDALAVFDDDGQLSDEFGRFIADQENERRSKGGAFGSRLMVRRLWLA